MDLGLQYLLILFLVTTKVKLISKLAPLHKFSIFFPPTFEILFYNDFFFRQILGQLQHQLPLGAFRHHRAGPIHLPNRRHLLGIILKKRKIAAKNKTNNP